MNKIVFLPIFLILIYLSSCTEEYENHALAFKNNTNDSIVLQRYYSQSIASRTFIIAPGEYAKIYETSTDLWISPPIELGKNSDSIIITGFLNQKDFQIKFTKDFVENYCSNPYSTASEWETEIKVEEYSKLFGKKLERFYIHIFNINNGCIAIE
jgi:hypothetical protein